MAKSAARVWVVLSGMKDTAGELHSVHRTHEGAVRAALKISSPDGHRWKASRGLKNHWLNSYGDYVAVAQYTVRK